MGRVLALDYGRRRLGMAISDPRGITARGIPTAQVRSREGAVAAASKAADEHQAGEIVIGIPLNMDGTSGPMAAEVEDFASKLERMTGLPVRRWDERLTSVEANRTLQEMGVRTKGRKGDVDRMSAILILQGYLSSKDREAGIVE